MDNSLRPARTLILIVCRDYKGMILNHIFVSLLIYFTILELPKSNVGLKKQRLWV